MNGRGRVGNMEILFQRNICGGVQTVFKHNSRETKCEMKFSIFVPNSDAYDEKFHVLFFLPGAECNEQHFLNRTEFHQHAADARFIVVCPDTSPRVDVPGDSDDRLIGKSASWYIDATEEPFAKHYQMFSYISKELYEIVLKHFPAIPKFGICGHSMGGSGAICIGLRNPDKFPSISLFAANCNPISWGADNVFTRLLGKDNFEAWRMYDGSEIVKRYDGPRREILLDQGSEDSYLKTLNPERLVAAALENPKGERAISVKYRFHQGLDHSYDFVKKFWKDHFEHHQRILFLVSQGL